VRPIATRPWSIAARHCRSRQAAADHRRFRASPGGHGSESWGVEPFPPYGGQSLQGPGGRGANRRVWSLFPRNGGQSLQGPGGRPGVAVAAPSNGPVQPQGRSPQRRALASSGVRGGLCRGARDLSLEGQWMAAVLHGGRGAVLSRRTALMLWSLTPRSAGMTRCTVPLDRRPKSQHQVREQEVCRIPSPGGPVVPKQPHRLIENRRSTWFGGAQAFPVLGNFPSPSLNPWGNLQ
jgi:hypothetical protein